jgi:hypothetical protein
MLRRCLVSFRHHLRVLRPGLQRSIGSIRVHPQQAQHVARFLVP